MQSIDVAVQNYFSLIHSPGTTAFMYLFTILFDFSLHFLVVIGCVTILIYNLRGRHLAFLFVSSLVYCFVLVFLLKFFLEVGRPPQALIDGIGYSFPSGHTAEATVFFVMLIYIFGRKMKAFWRAVFNLLCIVSITFVAFSRVYLGVHWASDVVFGVIFGLFVSWFSIFIFNHLSFTKKSQVVIK